MAQNQGGSLAGSSPFSAGAESPIELSGLKPGCIGALYCELDFSLKSIGSAFNLVIDTGQQLASEGTDDADLIAAALLSYIALDQDPGDRSVPPSITMNRLRSVLAFLNQDDYSGSLMAGGSVPVSTGGATAFTLLIRFPISLLSYFHDGDAYAQGSERLKQGQISPAWGSSATPSVVLANGTAVVSGLGAMKLWPEYVPGSPTDVGPTWAVRYVSGLPTIAPLGPAVRLGLLRPTSVGSDTVTTYLITGQIRTLNQSGLLITQDYVRDHVIQGGGPDLTKRAFPLIYNSRRSKGADLPTKAVQTVVDGSNGSASSLSFYDIVARPAPGDAVARTSADAVGGGADTAPQPVAPSSVRPGMPVGTPPAFTRPRSLPRQVAAALAPNVQPTASGNAVQLAAQHAANVSRVRTPTGRPGAAAAKSMRTRGR